MWLTPYAVSGALDVIQQYPLGGEKSIWTKAEARAEDHGAGVYDRQDSVASTAG